MKIALISFTKTGYVLAERIAELLKEEGHTAKASVKCGEMSQSIDGPAGEWVEQRFGKSDALIFIGAAGIAVRLIAPFLSSKTKDPAVLVIDEKGTYCIPILSGHIGGANALAIWISNRIHAEAVLTTATDIQGKWAVDVFAVKNGLCIPDIQKARRVSADLLAGKPIQIVIEGEEANIQGEIPKGLQIARAGVQDEKADVFIGIHRKPEAEGALTLIPRAVCAGIGCRKGTEAIKIEQAVMDTIEQAGIWPQSIEKAASIDLKAEEEGILSFCKNHQLPFETYPSEELEQTEGEYSFSEFVKNTTGTGNVCERSAVKGSRGGTLLVTKQVYEGVTVALAVRKWSVCFE